MCVFVVVVVLLFCVIVIVFALLVSLVLFNVCRLGLFCLKREEAVWIYVVCFVFCVLCIYICVFFSLVCIWCLAYHVVLLLVVLSFVVFLGSLLRVALLCVVCCSLCFDCW